jgi:hypothetical protein
MAVQQQAGSTWEMARADSQTSFEGIQKALAQLSHAPGARVMLMASAGFLTGLMDSDKSAIIDTAVHDNIVINALDAKGLWSEAPGREAETVGSLPVATFLFETSTIGSRMDALNNVMQEFASGTGGLFFHNSNDLVGGFAQLGAVPESTYLIAFRPDSTAEAGQFHKLKVQVAHKGDYVQARPGYITPAAAASEVKTEIRPIDQEAAGSDVLTQIPVRLAARVGGGDNARVLTISIHVDLADLPFTQRDDRYLQKLDFIGELLDASGKVVAAKEGAMDFALRQNTLDRLKTSGVNAELTLSAPPGPYRIRLVVADAEGKMAAGTQSVDLAK